MTREEAIEVIKAYRDKLTNSASNQLDGDIEALEMAIKALEQNESAEEWYKLFVEKLDEQEPCDELISREDVLAEITRFSTEEGASVECQQLYCDVNNMPSVTHKSGKWIGKDFRKEEYVLAGKCSVCGQVRVIDKFCSHCGAKMESEDKE